MNIGKSIVVFNLMKSDKITVLNTGDKFNYEYETYEVMNRELVDSPKNYVKFNCLRKVKSANESNS